MSASPDQRRIMPESTAVVSFFLSRSIFMRVRPVPSHRPFRNSIIFGSISFLYSSICARALADCATVSYSEPWRRVLDIRCRVADCEQRKQRVPKLRLATTFWTEQIEDREPVVGRSRSHHVAEERGEIETEAPHVRCPHTL